MLKRYFELKTAQAGPYGDESEGYKKGVYRTFLATNYDETEKGTGKNTEVYYRTFLDGGEIKIDKIICDGIELKRVPNFVIEQIKNDIITEAE